MTSLTVKIQSGDAALSDNDSDARSELAGMLRKIARRLEDGHDDGGLMDSNGNKCGFWDYEAPETDDEGEE